MLQDIEVMGRGNGEQVDGCRIVQRQVVKIKFAGGEIIDQQARSVT